MIHYHSFLIFKKTLKEGKKPLPQLLLIEANDPLSFLIFKQTLKEGKEPLSQLLLIETNDPLSLLIFKQTPKRKGAAAAAPLVGLF